MERLIHGLTTSLDGSPLRLLVALLLIAGCATAPPRDVAPASPVASPAASPVASPVASPAASPPPELLGHFVDDYGNAFELSPDEFRQLPRNRFHVVEWHPRERFLVARNDSANAGDAGLWTRIDWMPFADMAPYTWGFCLTAYRAPSREAARATPAANRATPRTGCNGHPFSRLRPAP